MSFGQIPGWPFITFGWGYGSESTSTSTSTSSSTSSSSSSSSPTTYDPVRPWGRPSNPSIRGMLHHVWGNGQYSNASAGADYVYELNRDATWYVTEPTTVTVHLPIPPEAIP